MCNCFRIICHLVSVICRHCGDSIFFTSTGCYAHFNTNRDCTCCYTSKLLTCQPIRHIFLHLFHIFLVKFQLPASKSRRTYQTTWCRPADVVILKLAGGKVGRVGSLGVDVALQDEVAEEDGRNQLSPKHKRNWMLRWMLTCTVESELLASLVLW